MAVEILDKFLHYAERVHNKETLRDYEQMVFGFCDTYIRAGIYANQVQIAQAEAMLDKIEEGKRRVDPVGRTLKEIDLEGVGTETD